MRISPMFIAATAAAVFAFAALGPSSGAEDESGRALDLAYYKARVAPIVHTYCGSCHSNRRGRAGRLRLVPKIGRTITDAHHEANFEAISRLIQPGNPARSPFLLKGLGPQQGGLEHGGGACLEEGSTSHKTLLAFIGGATLKPEPESTPAGSGESETADSKAIFKITTAGLTIPAEDFDLEGELTLALHPDHPPCAKPGKAGGTAALQFRLAEAGTWLVTLEVAGPGEGLAWSLDGKAARIQPPVGPGRHGVGTDVVLDHGVPLVSQSGRLAYDGAWLSMRGRPSAPASWLTAKELAQQSVQATVRLPAKADGGDDALLLFDMKDTDNGKYVGLVDAGRRFVLGLIEGGTSRVVSSVDAPAAKADTARVLEVEFLEGVAIGRLDGQPLAFLHLDRNLVGAGRCGLRTHGALLGESLGVEGPEKSHQVAFSQASTVKMRSGRHRVRIDLPPSAPGLVSVTLRKRSE